MHCIRLGLGLGLGFGFGSRVAVLYCILVALRTPYVGSGRFVSRWEAIKVKGSASMHRQATYISLPPANAPCRTCRLAHVVSNKL